MVEAIVDHLSDRGPRADNQDAVAARALPEGRVVVVLADGVSGVQCGGEAARRTAKTVLEHWSAQAGRWSGESLHGAVVEANRLLLEAEPRGQYQTTLVALALDLQKREGFCVSSGDSWAACLEADGRYRKLTASDSEAAALVRRGVAGRLGARILAGAATRGLGSDHRPPVDVESFEIQPGSRFVVATDGLDVLQEREVPALLRRSRSGSSAHDLVAWARRRGLLDNVTVATVCVPPHSRPVSSGRPDRRWDWAPAVTAAVLLAVVLARDAGLTLPGGSSTVQAAPSAPSVSLDVQGMVHATVPTATPTPQPSPEPPPEETAGVQPRDGEVPPDGDEEDGGRVSSTPTPDVDEEPTAEAVSQLDNTEEDQDP